MDSETLKKADERFKETITDALKRIPFSGLNHPLYHFTDTAGLTGILSTKSLWATLATALEDTSEIIFALSRAKRILKSGEVNCNWPFLNEVIELLDIHKAQAISTIGMKAYIVCFRTSLDASAHWVKYGHCGKGFALAFALKPLLIPGILPIPVIYDSIEQDKLLREFLESNARVFEELSQDCPPDMSWALRQRAIRLTALGLWVLSPLIKALSFESESELRLIVIDFQGVETDYGVGVSSGVESFRSGSREVPYKVLKYDALPIVELVMGASTTEDESDAGLRRLLFQATAGREVPIRRSRGLSDQKTN